MHLPNPIHGLRLVVIGALTCGLLAGGGAAVAASVPTDAGTDFHVACRSGAATGDGTSTHPWTSLSEVGDHGAFSPGDRILLRRGTVCHGRIAPSGSGSAASPILLGAEGRGARPTIVGGGTASGTGAVQLQDVAWWTVQDLHITNAGARNTTARRSGVLVRNTGSTRLAGITLQRLAVDSVDSDPRGDARAYGGISVLSTEVGGGFDGTVIADSSVDHAGRTGIAVFNTATISDRDRNLRITGNRVTWARGDSIVVDGVTHARIDHNRSAHGSNLAPCPVRLCGPMGGTTTASAGIWPIFSDDVRLDHNEVYGEHKSAGDGAGMDIDLGVTHVVVERNYLHDNEGGGLMFCGAQHVTARFNIIQNNAKSSIAFTCGWHRNELPQDITITNNDIVTDRAHPAYYVVRNIHPHPGKRIRFTNNVVSCVGTCAYTWPITPFAARNTYLGTRSRTEPVGAGSRHGGSPLRAPGTGKVGFGSLSGYHLTAAGRRSHGVAISGSQLTDLFGRAVSAKHPPRGAAVR